MNFVSVPRQGTDPLNGFRLGPKARDRSDFLGFRSLNFEICSSKHSLRLRHTSKSFLERFQPQNAMKWTPIRFYAWVPWQWIGPLGRISP